MRHGHSSGQSAVESNEDLARQKGWSRWKSSAAVAEEEEDERGSGRAIYSGGRLGFCVAISVRSLRWDGRNTWPILGGRPSRCES